MSKFDIGRAEAWRRLAERLELEKASERAPKLRQFLNLAPSTVFGPVYRTYVETGEDHEAGLYLFEYTPHRQNPAAEVEGLASVCMLAVYHEISPIPLKALRKRHRVLESIDASATGSAIVPFSEVDEAFDKAVTVFARDEATAHRLLTSGTRTLLKRALCEREVAPTFLLGERQLFFTHAAPATQPTPLNVLESLATDLLSLYALLSAPKQTPPPAAPPPKRGGLKPRSRGDFLFLLTPGDTDAPPESSRRGRAARAVPSGRVRGAGSALRGSTPRQPGFLSFRCAPLRRLKAGSRC